jgi:hypothetical protein
MTPRRILLAGWAAFLIYAWPGFMSTDSTVQLLEARAWSFGDGHPPLMAVVWRVLELVISGPAGMILVQSACVLFGAYHLLRRALSARAAAIAACAILLFPPNLATFAVVWKDSQMAAYLIAGTAAILSERAWVRYAGLFLLFLASGMRYNAFPATFAIVVLLWPSRGAFVRRHAIALAAWAAITGASFAANKLLVDREWHYWHWTIAYMDIAGTLHHGGPHSDDDLRATLDGVPLRADRDIQAAIDRAFDPADFLYQNRGRDQLFRRPKDAAQRDAIARAWRRVVLGDPTAYLAYRFAVFREVLHLSDRDHGSPAYVWFVDIQDPWAARDATDHFAEPSGFQTDARDAMLELGDTWLFRPYLYLAIALVLVPFAVRAGRDAFAVVASGLAYQAALIFVAPTPDFRYSHWLVASVTIAVVMVVARRAAARRTSA